MSSKTTSPKGQKQTRSFHTDWTVDWTRPLGEGTYGKVFVATSKTDPGKRVALKVFATDEMGIQAQRKEVLAYSALRGVCEKAGMVCMVNHGFEFMLPDSNWPPKPNPFVLLTLVENAHDGFYYLGDPRGIKMLQAATWEQFSGTMIAGARQLERFHRLGWAIRDIKPANVMISWPERKCVFIDLNLSCDLRACQAWTGTEPYVHPAALALRIKLNSQEKANAFNRSPLGGEMRRANDVWAFGQSFADFFLLKAFGKTFADLFPLPPANPSSRTASLIQEYRTMAQGDDRRFELARAQFERMFRASPISKNRAASFAKTSILKMLRWGNPSSQVVALQEVAKTDPNQFTQSQAQKVPSPKVSQPRTLSEKAASKRSPKKNSPIRRKPDSPDHIPTPQLMGAPMEEDPITTVAKSVTQRTPSPRLSEIPTPQLPGRKNSPPKRQVTRGHIPTPELKGTPMEDEIVKPVPFHKRVRSPRLSRIPTPKLPPSNQKKKSPSSPKKRKTPPKAKKVARQISPSGKKTPSPKNTDRKSPPKAEPQKGASKSSSPKTIPFKKVTSRRSASPRRRTASLENCPQRMNKLCPISKQEMIDDLASAKIQTKSSLKILKRPEIWALHQKHFPTRTQ